MPRTRWADAPLFAQHHSISGEFVKRQPEKDCTTLAQTSLSALRYGTVKRAVSRRRGDLPLNRPPDHAPGRSTMRITRSQAKIGGSSRVSTASRPERDPLDEVAQVSSPTFWRRRRTAVSSAGRSSLTGGREDGMGGVEVAVGEVVAHPDDLRPRKGRLAGEQFRWESFDRFADLDSPNPYGVEDEPIIQIAPLEVCMNGIDGGHNVLETLTVSAGQSATASARTSAAMGALRPPAGTRSTRVPSSPSSSA